MKIVETTELLITLIMILLVGMPLDAGISFSSADAKIALAASGVKLNVANAMTISNGTFQRVTGASMTGVNPLFSNGIFMLDNTEVAMNQAVSVSGMTYSPTNIFPLTGNNTYDAKNTTTSLQGITVSGQNNLIVGAPIFHGTNALTLSDNTATVSLAVSSVLDRKVVLNGGGIYLSDNLSFGDTGAFRGQGSVTFNDYRLNLGGGTSVWTSTVRLVNATDICMNGDIHLAGQMIFDGNATVNGNGATLDLSLGGTIRVKANSTVMFNDLKIKGLNKYGTHGTGSNAGVGGNIEFDAQTSIINFDQVEVEMSNNYTFTTGGFYVDGASSFGVKNYLMTFDQKATLTVDGTSLTYEPLAYQDQNNIVGNHTYSINQINGGAIRMLWSNPLQYTFSANTTLGLHVVLSATKTMLVTSSLTLNGNNTFIYFGSSPTPLLIVNPGCTLTLTNVILMNFNFNQIQLGAGSNIVFGDGTQIEFAVNQTLPTSYLSNVYFKGNVNLIGKGQQLDLTNTASLTIGGHSSTLMLDGVIVKNLRGTMLRMLDSNSTLSIKNSALKLSSSYTFTQGHFVVVGDSTIMGDGQIFSYESPQTSSICSRSMLTIDRNTTFSYSPHGSTNKALIWQPDITSVMFFNGGTLQTTTTGIQFTRGTLLADGKVNFYNNGATSLSQAIVFGDGRAAHDANISIMPAATINLQSGLINYNNAS